MTDNGRQGNPVPADSASVFGSIFGPVEQQWPSARFTGGENGEHWYMDHGSRGEQGPAEPEPGGRVDGVQGSNHSRRGSRDGGQSDATVRRAGDEVAEVQGLGHLTSTHSQNPSDVQSTFDSEFTAPSPAPERVPVEQGADHSDHPTPGDRVDTSRTGLSVFHPGKRTFDDNAVTDGKWTFSGDVASVTRTSSPPTETIRPAAVGRSVALPHPNTVSNQVEESEPARTGRIEPARAHSGLAFAPAPQEA